MEASTSSGVAVSGLMQQLKSGEISKMQLFQQLAKLQKDGDEQQYIDFAKQFSDELNGNHASNSGGGKNGGKVSCRSNNNTDGQFHARVTRWKSQKDAIRENMKQQLLQSELNECTFAPKINPKSMKVVAKLRGQQPTTTANQGLSTGQAVSERLYQEADNYRIREELATKLKADEEAEIERQCTFRPKINPSDKDPNCTFKPAINQTSVKRKPRSITELSRGDLLRRETTQRLMKLKMEQEEMAALTFRPQLSRMSERAEGKLKILSSPDTYLQRIQQQSQAHTIKQRRAMQEKEMGEFAECTFKPRTIEAPAYVQRIARSVSLTKALRAQQQAAARAREKPEWK
ncbi:hypothetical protein BBO99_00003985 [Phytophthora kernoviae]|uniref:Uncharacterized protein n=2 Tax=Phytophthora kernoviae TaxID=325452 RepID=A0A421GSG9_9STRA|nr:hypothetical protein G195_009019 [Phytophthora kernoviae 00238/432]KAG2518622.1 hypothetical protein JM16_006315 [Phytophthora kernoviae]KAG2519687.1 hypothetical protein JM18_006828 [Phytophthora kernoviae]RLN81087.1 hypothetical protein BBO99_00003985 [Phytophthora kernoviae]